MSNVKQVGFERYDGGFGSETAKFIPVCNGRESEQRRRERARASWEGAQAHRLANMEYERALFRVYDKSMEGFRSPAVRNTCNLAQKLFLVLSAGLFATLVLLHHQFVDNPGCLGPLLEEAARREGVLIEPSAVRADGKRIGAITANDTVVGTIEIPESEGVIDPGAEGDGEGLDGDGEEGDESREEEEEEELHPTKIKLPSGAMIPYDVLIGVSIGSGGKGKRRWWGLRGAANDGDGRKLAAGNGHHGGSQNADDIGGERANGNSTRVGNSRARGKAHNDTGFSADYTFALEPVVLRIPEKMQEDHAFQWVNITLEPSECLHEAGLMARALAATAVGYDVIMINMFMFTLQSRGLLKNTETGAEWMWSKDSKPTSGVGRLLTTIEFKAQVVVRSITAFVLMSTVTAMTVRTLLSSGVVIMFPMVMILERIGLQGVDVHQMLALSYPWLGLPIEHLRSHNKPIGPFIMGHIMQMVVFYTVYNACLLAWSYWLYGNSMTTLLEVWLFGMVMLWEYFSLIFVRARSSIVFFSRTAALSFVAFHVYFYHFQMGYFGLAACSAFAGMFAVKLYVLQAIELPAYVSGEISHEQPRAHFVELPWPTWGAALPPMWSLFIPPNASSVGVYGNAVPDRPPGAAGRDTNDGGDDHDGGGGGGGGVHAGGAVGDGGDQAQNIPPGSAERREGARVRGRARARGRAGVPGPGRTQPDRPLMGGRRRGGGGGGGGGGGDEIEMAQRRRRGSSGGMDMEEG